MVNLKLKQKIAYLEQRIAELEKINNEHRQLNGLLRQEIADLRICDLPYICQCGEVIMNDKEKRDHRCVVRQ